MGFNSAFKGLTDVVITNKDSTSDIATVMDLEYSDHKAQLLRLNVKKW